MILEDADDKKVYLSIVYKKESKEVYCEANKTALKQFSSYAPCYEVFRMSENEIPFYGYFLINNEKRVINFSESLAEAIYEHPDIKQTKRKHLKE